MQKLFSAGLNVKCVHGDVAGAMADLKLVRDRAWGGTAPAVMQDSARL